MPSINTLRGPLDTQQLGRTLMHEHVAIRTPGIGENWPELWDEDYWTDAADQKLNGLSSRGIGTIVDLINHKTIATDYNRKMAYESFQMAKMSNQN